MSSSSPPAPGCNINGLPLSIDLTKLTLFLKETLQKEGITVKFNVVDLIYHQKSASAVVSFSCSQKKLARSCVESINGKLYLGMKVKSNARWHVPVEPKRMATNVRMVKQTKSKMTEDSDLSEQEIARLSASFHKYLQNSSNILIKRVSTRKGATLAELQYYMSQKKNSGWTKKSRPVAARRRQIEALIMSKLRTLGLIDHDNVLAICRAGKQEGKLGGIDPTIGAMNTLSSQQRKTSNGVSVGDATLRTEDTIKNRMSICSQQKPQATKCLVVPKGVSTQLYVNLFLTRKEFAMNLKGVTFLGRSQSKHFRLVTPATFPIAISKDQDQNVTLAVSVPTDRIGILRLGVLFSFTSAISSKKKSKFVKPFTVVRWVKVKGKASDSAMENVLAPTAPYHRKQRERFRREIPAKVFKPPRNGSEKSPFVDLATHAIPPALQKELIKGRGDSLVEVWPGNPDDEAKDFGAHLIQNKYSKFWKALLWCSEHQLSEDVLLFDMKNADLRREGNNLVLLVPGLAEGRPSVLKGDMVNVIWKNSTFKGRVTQIRQLEIVMEFHSNFCKRYNPSVDRADVRFTYSRMSYRIMHEACIKAEIHMQQTMLLPTEMIKTSIAVNATERTVSKKTWANRNLNKEQYTAINKIIAGRLRPLPYIIFGPPGTGKTTTLVEMVYQLAHHPDNIKILLVTPSNDAANILVERLAHYFPPSEMRRILSFTRSIDTIPTDIRPYVGGSDNQVTEILSARIVVCTIGLATKFTYLGVPKGFFDVMCVDEAGHATEPEVIAAAACLMNFFPLKADGAQVGQLILAGDPKQLGPVISSVVCKQFGLGLSYMERLSQLELYQRTNGKYQDELLTKLVQNYRSHPHILNLPNTMFYDGELETCGDKMVTHSMANWEHLPCKGFPIIFHAIEGENLREANSPSWFNPQEAEQAVEYVKLLVNQTKPPLKTEDIGIITPYARQAQKIRKALATQNLPDVKVGTVEIFQGQERRCIIISTVRADESELSSDLRFNIGFIANPKRFNVAVTRAKTLLIVVGCPRLLALDKYHWLPFMKYCHEHKSWAGEAWDPTDIILEHDVEAEDDGDAILGGPSSLVEQEGISVVYHEE